VVRGPRGDPHAVLDPRRGVGRRAVELAAELTGAAAAVAREEAEVVLGSDGARWRVGWLGLRKDLRSGRGV